MSETCNDTQLLPRERGWFRDLNVVSELRQKADWTVVLTALPSWWWHSERGTRSALKWLAAEVCNQSTAGGERSSGSSSASRGTRTDSREWSTRGLWDSQTGETYTKRHRGLQTSEMLLFTLHVSLLSTDVQYARINMSIQSSQNTLHFSASSRQC